jgi:hypothetical protein
MDRSGNLITEHIFKGRMKHTDLERLFSGRIDGDATKYLANYMSKWLEIFNTEKDTIKSKNLLVQSHTAHTDTKLKDFRTKQTIYI